MKQRFQPRENQSPLAMTGALAALLLRRPTQREAQLRRTDLPRLIAGYQSANNPGSTKELFFRWTAFGAWSPVMRTHHGTAPKVSWRFDTDAETLAQIEAIDSQQFRRAAAVRDLREELTRLAALDA